MSTPEERARARASWPVVRTTLAADDVPRCEDMSVAWDAVGELTRQAWGLVAGAPKPRSEWVCRRFLPGEPRPDTLEELNCSR